MDAGYNLEGDYYANDNWSKTGYEIWDWETNWTGPDPGITYDESDPQWAKAAISYYRTQYEQAVGNNDHAKTKEAYAQIYTIKEYVANNTVPGAILDIEPITQQPYDMACVPTSLLMISNYYFPEDGYTLENMRQMLNKTLQYDVFRYGVFHDDHEKITRSTPFQCTLNSTYIIGEMVSFTDSDIVVSELKNSNPLMGIVYWENGNSHAVVICGYITVNSETGILYNDPWDGTQHYIPYYNFIVKNGFDGNGTLGSYFTTSK